MSKSKPKFKHILHLHRMALFSTVRLLWVNRFTTLLNLAMVGVTVALPLGLYALVGGLQQLTDNLPNSLQASVYLSPKSGPNDMERILATVRAKSSLVSMRLIDKEQALQDWQDASGLTDLVDALGSNPLPDTLVLTFKEVQTNEVEALLTQLRSDPSIDQVEFDSEWMRRLASIIGLGQQLALCVSILFGLGLLLVMLNLIRMQILGRHDEIEVSKLIGAPDEFIRRPFLYFAAVQGVLGALVGMAVVGVLLALINRPVMALAALYNEHFSLSLPSIPMLIITLLVVLGLSLLGAAISVQRHLQAFSR